MPLKTDHGASLWAYEGPCDMWLHTKDSAACTGSNIVMLRLALRGRNVGGRGDVLCCRESWQKDSFGTDDLKTGRKLTAAREDKWPGNTLKPRETRETPSNIVDASLCVCVSRFPVGARRCV